MTAAKKTKAKPLGSFIHIGAEIASIKEIRSAINDILKVPYADNETKRSALDALARATSVNNTSICNSSFQA